ncbi:MAG: efflux RND transporter periplasmic adaptor subunit [Caulobacterales bacterium]
MTRLQLIGLAAALLALNACGPRGAAPPAAPAPAGERWQVSAQSIPDFKPVAATVTARDMAEARARIGGTLVRLNVKEGDLVRRGQVIGVVTDERIGFETRAFDAQVGAAQADASRAQADLARTQDLFDHGVYAKARLDQARAAARAAEGSLNAARAQRSASAEMGAQGAILAPSDGRVLRADVPAGSVVSPGLSVATLTAGPTVLRVEIPEAEAEGLKVGQTVSLASEDLGQSAAGASIQQIYPAVTNGQVVADLAAPGLKDDLVGRRVRVKLQIGRRSALVIPARFVISRFGVDYARVLARDNTTSDVPVEVAPGPDPNSVEILSGLAPGDTLVRPGAGR